MPAILERRLLQLMVALCALVPVGAGTAGAISGAGFFHLSGSATAESHGAYLSGLLLGIGLGFWSCLPAIENKYDRMCVLTATVFIGGLARLWSVAFLGADSPSVWFALAMELLVTPGLWLWQRRIAQ